MADRTFLQRAWDLQHRIERRFARIGKGRYARVLRMARKPEPAEFRHTAGIVLVGITVIGAIGFVIFLLMTWVLRLVGAV